MLTRPVTQIGRLGPREGWALVLHHTASQGGSDRSEKVGFLPVLKGQEEGQVLSSQRGEGLCLNMPPLPVLCVQGGNDFEIFADPRTVGHSVVSPQDTVQRCREIFFPETAHEA